MLLNELEIVERLTRDDETRISLKPLIDLRSQLGPSSIDVRLGTEFQVIKPQQYTHLDPAKEDEEKVRLRIMRYTDHIQARFHPRYGGFVLHPGEFALGSTLEYINLPRDIAARLEGRSSWSRIGLQVHVTGGFIDQGFCGAVTFELCNLGKVPLQLYVGLRVAQLAFYETTTTLKSYPEKTYTKYGGQASTGSSQLYKDKEFECLRKLQEESPPPIHR